MTKLMEPILDPRVQSPHYFQGRLLTASDLAAERDAHLARQRFLGQAIGSGVVKGLWVELADDGAASNAPSVSISAGLAINPEGQILSLEDPQTLMLADVLEESVADAGLFSVCEPPETQAVPTGEGFYLLLVQPVSDFRERAPMSSINVEKAGAGCGSKWSTPGVRFRLVQLNPLNVPGTTDATRALLEELLLASTNEAQVSRLRNVVAHLCLGGDEPVTFVADPFAQEGGEPLLASYGAVDYLRGQSVVTECDVPLALIYWTGDGLEIVDPWAVRRRPLAAPISNDWPSVSGVRRRVEAEARMLQFQQHLGELLGSVATPSTLDGSAYFRFLPAAGFLPLAGETTGFDPGSFFGDLPFRSPVEYINGEQIGRILQLSYHFDPIEFPDEATDEELVWVYRPWQQIPAAAADQTDRSYLIFTSGHLPPMNTARYDVARWDFSNFADPLAGGVAD